MDIFEECVKFLYKYNYKKLGDDIKHIRQLFCIGYIKVYIHTFMKNIKDKDNKKIKDSLSIINKLDKLSDEEKKMNTIITLYIYKSIYYQNQKQFHVFLDKNSKKNYKFDKYKGFKKFFDFKEEENNNYGFT